MDGTITEYLSGAVENIVYANEENGYCVIEIDANDELITAVGTIPAISVGEEVVLTGRYTTHPTYGHQFKVELCERTLPATASAIYKYLSSRAVKGIGPRTARRIVDKFGDNTLEVIEKEPHKLTELKGISLAKAEEISENYKLIYGIRSMMLELAKHGIDSESAIRVWKQWGPLSIEIIEEDPYRLCGEAIGIPFEKADEVAAKLGIEPDSPLRMRAGLVFVLTHNLTNGHTCAPKQQLLELVAVKLCCNRDELAQTLDNALDDEVLISDTINQVQYIYLPSLYEAETYIAGRISMMLKITSPEPKNYSSDISRLEDLLGIEYATNQRQAITMAMQNQVFILTGGPGTGKTTTLNGIISLLTEEDSKFALAAPTGRAAKRMSEICLKEAKTIHRLLEVDFRDDSSDLVKFKRNEKNPLNYDTIILDEVSMVDTRLMASLMKAIKLSCRLILVGDPNQLPSVGAGNIMGDLINSDVVPTVHLNEIFRQAEQSHIVVSSHKIVSGDLPDLSKKDSDLFFIPAQTYESATETLLDLCHRRLPKAYKFSPLWDIQVISPTRKGALGTAELNRRLQEKLNPASGSKDEHKFGTRILREQDKVMQIKNNYDINWRRDDGVCGTGVFNGDIGVVELIDRPSQTVLIRYDDKVATYTFDMVDEIEHAYAVTVHKSQGSEFDAVIMPVGSFNKTLHYRNLLYTGVTRAKKLLILLGSKDTIYGMVYNDRKTKRYTNLAEFLKESTKKLEIEQPD